MAREDFVKGQSVWIILVGNAARRKSGADLIQEWEVTKVGRKYIHAVRKGASWEFAFEYRDYGENGGVYVEKTEYSPDYILFPTRKDAEEKVEKDRLYQEISTFFSRYDSKWRLTIEQMRKIKEIIE